MKTIKYTAIRIAVLAMRLLYLPMKALPTKNKVTMLSRQADHDSIDMQLLKERILHKHPDYQVVLLSKKLKNPVVYVFHILLQMYHIATSRAVILDSYCIPVSVLHHKPELIVIQMWHSMGSMKKFGFAMLQMEEGSDPQMAAAMHMHQNYTYILISSFSYLEDYLEGFRTTPEKVKQIPQPRADLLTDPAFMRRVRERVIEANPWFGAKKNIVYCPTFRKQPTEQDQQKIKELIEAVDYRHYNLIYKPHTVSELQVKDPRVIPSNMDNVEMLAIADYMISDYSSIIYEAGLCDIPVYLYMYDWEEYSQKRALNLDYEKDVPLMQSKHASEIIKAIEAWDGKGDRCFNAQSFRQFVDTNVVMPETSCCEEIMRLMNL